jgi:hypothetical protein
MITALLGDNTFAPSARIVPPFWIVVFPLYVFAPPRDNTPPLFCVTAPVPLIAPV